MQPSLCLYQTHTRTGFFANPSAQVVGCGWCRFRGAGSRAPIVFHANYVDALQLLRCYHSFPVDGTFSCVRSPLQDEGIIPECEWLAGVYGSRRPHGWQGCDEIQDQSGRRERLIQRGLLCPHYFFNHNNVYVRN